MSIIQAIFLGIVQGVTEVLPISSSAHLVLVPWLFKFTDPGLSFDVALHIGTLFAILVYFFSDWKRIAVGLGRKESKSIRLTGFIIIATIPGIAAGYLLDSQAESSFRHPILIAVVTSVFAIFLLFSEKIKGALNLEKLSYKRSLLVGISQALAIIPGVSRSGVTITTGMSLGLTREAAAKFSFLISAPIIFGAGFYEATKIDFTKFDYLIFFVGFFASLISSLIAIRFLMNFVRKNKLNIFAYYRFGLAALIVTIYFLRS